MGGSSISAGCGGGEGFFGSGLRCLGVWFEPIKVDVVDVDGPLGESEGEGEWFEVVAGLTQALDVSQMRHLIIN